MKQTLLYGLAVSSFLLFSCSREDMPNYETEAGNPNAITLESVTLDDFSSETSSRASYVQDAAMVFGQDDKLGLILLDADGNRIDHISYSYIQAENRWNLNDPTKYYSSNIKKVIAYFPYNASLATNVNTMDALKNTITIGTDQSDPENFKKCDLLVEEITSPSQKLTVNLVHAFSLIEFKSDPVTLSANGKEYKYNVELQNVSMVIGETDYQLCNLNGTYSLLVKDGFEVPANDFRYFYSLGKDSYVKTLNTKKTTESGKKYTFPCQTAGEYAPGYAAGDFYCTDNADGNVVIVPGGATAIPEGLTCHGIIFHYLEDFSGFATTNGITATDYPGYGENTKHGLIVGFSVGGSFNSGTAPDATTLTSIYSTASINEEAYKSQTTMNGFKLTQAMLSGTKSGWEFTALGDYASSQVPDATSWYAPSFQELKYMVWGSGATIASQNGLDKIRSQVAKIGEDWGDLQNIPSLTIGESFIIAMTAIQGDGNADGTWSATLAGEPFRPICAF